MAILHTFFELYFFSTLWRLFSRSDSGQTRQNTRSFGHISTVYLELLSLAIGARNVHDNKPYAILIIIPAMLGGIM